MNDVEISILNAIQHMRTPILDTIMCVITKLGNAGMIWILLTVILLIIPKTRRNRSDPDAGAVRGCRALQWNPEESG